MSTNSVPYRIRVSYANCTYIKKRMNFKLYIKINPKQYKTSPKLIEIYSNPTPFGTQAAILVAILNNLLIKEFNNNRKSQDGYGRCVYSLRWQCVPRLRIAKSSSVF